MDLRREIFLVSPVERDKVYAVCAHTICDADSVVFTVGSEKLQMLGVIHVGIPFVALNDEFDLCRKMANQMQRVWLERKYAPLLCTKRVA